MKTPEDLLYQEARNTLEECFDQMRLARATELARSRRFLEAEALLAPSGRMPEKARELDVLARICAQQRRYREARRCWEGALQLAPSNEVYRNGIKRLDQLEKLKKLRINVALIGVAALTITMVVVWALKLSPLGSLRTPNHQSQPTQPPAAPHQPKQKTPSEKAPSQPSAPSPPKPAQPSPTSQKR